MNLPNAHAIIRVGTVTIGIDHPLRYDVLYVIVWHAPGVTTIDPRRKLHLN